MPLNTEEVILDLTAGMGDLKAGLARVETKLDAHVKSEDAWRAEVQRIAAARVGWVQTIIASVASSGALLGLWKLLTRE